MLRPVRLGRPPTLAGELILFTDFLFRTFSAYYLIVWFRVLFELVIQSRHPTLPSARLHEASRTPGLCWNGVGRGTVRMRGQGQSTLTCLLRHFACTSRDRAAQGERGD